MRPMSKSLSVAHRRAAARALSPLNTESLAELRHQISVADNRSDLGRLLHDVALLAAAGDTLATDLLLETIDLHDFARSAVSRQLFNRDDQDDVLQDVLIAVARSIDSFRGEASLLTWLHQLSTNCSIAFLRRERATSRMPDEPPASEAIRISSMIASREVIRSVIEDLPDLYRDAVVLRDVNQLSYAEVAERLGLNLNTTRARIARGRFIVAAHLLDEGVDGRSD